MRTTVSQSSGSSYFYSYKLKSSQLNYSILEKELFALIKVLKQLIYMLSGQRIQVKCDHFNLQYLDKLILYKVL